MEIPETLKEKFDTILKEEGVKSPKKVDAAYVQSKNQTSAEYRAVKEKETKEPGNVEEPPVEIPDNIGNKVEDVPVKPETSADDGYEEIPDRLVNAARKRGFSDEKIVSLAENSPEVLEALAEAAEEVENIKAQPQINIPQPEIQSQAQSKEDEDLSFDKSLDSLDDEALKTIIKRQNVLIEKIKNVENKVKSLDSDNVVTKQQRQKDFDNYVDSVLDSKKDICPDVGVSTSLTNTGLKTRKTIYQMAAVLRNSQGLSLEQALNAAVNAYNGINGDKKATERLLRKVNDNKQRFTSRPTGQKTNKVYLTNRDKALDVIDQKFKEYGIK